MKCRRVLLPLLVAITFSATTSAQPDFSWERIDGPQGYVPIKLLALDSSGAAWAASERILYRSRDEGTTWERIFEHFNAISIAVSPDGSIVAIDRYGNVQRSGDHGESWSAGKVLASDHRHYHRIFLVDDSTQIVSVGRTEPYEIFRSRDTGRTWALLTDCGDSDDTARIDRIGRRVFITRCEGLAYFDLDDPTDSLVRINSFWPLTNVVGVEGGALYTAHFSAVWKSTNMGRNWSRVLDIRYLDQLMQYDHGTILAINNDSIVASHDDGKTWALHSRTGHSTDVRVVRTRNGRLLASTASHLYASNDTGHSWSTSWEGIEGMTIGAMTVAPDGTIIVGGWNSAFHVRDQKTSEWRYITHNEQDPDWPLTHKTNVVTDFDYADSSMLFAATSGGTVLTTDNGITWRRLHSTPRPILDIAVSQKGIVLAAYNVFSGNIGRPYYRSEDFGKTWQNVDSRGVGSLFYSDRYDLLFSTDLDSRWRRDTVLWSSTDAGKTWQELEVAAPGGRYYIDHRTDDIYLIGERSSGETMKLWRSTDGGRSWRATPMEYGLRPGGGRDLAVTVDGDVYFVADTSLYAHIRGDSLFRRVEANGPALRIRGVEVMPDGRLLVDAGRTGLFLSSRSVLHVADKERATGSLTPLHYLGDARYRLEAAIGWHEPQLALYDLHGRRVFGAEGSLQLDADGVTIDLGGLPTGLYFLIVQKNGIEGSVHYALVRP